MSDEQRKQPTVVQFDAGPLKVGDSAPRTPGLGETILEVDGRVTLTRIPQGPIVLHVEPSEPETRTTPETLIQTFSSGSGREKPPRTAKDEEAEQREPEWTAKFQNNFMGDNTTIGQVTIAKEIKDLRLD